MVIEILVSALLLLGGAFALIGSIGLARLPDVFMRLHGPTKATTLGLGGILTASAIYFSVLGEGISLHEILVTFFLFMTAPVSAHLLAKVGLYLKVEHQSAGTLPEDLAIPRERPSWDPD